MNYYSQSEIKGAFFGGGGGGRGGILKKEYTGKSMLYLLPGKSQMTKAKNRILINVLE